MEVLAPEHLEQIIRFGNKATGWLFVALGAFFIAVKETWELPEIYHWPVIIFWLLIIVMLIVSAVNTIVRMREPTSPTRETRCCRRPCSRSGVASRSADQRPAMPCSSEPHAAHMIHLVTEPAEATPWAPAESMRA